MTFVFSYQGFENKDAKFAWRFLERFSWELVTSRRHFVAGCHSVYLYNGEQESHSFTLFNNLRRGCETKHGDRCYVLLQRGFIFCNNRRDHNKVLHFKKFYQYFH